jgi:hypothetical protein
MNCRSVSTHDLDRCRYFDISCDAFYRLITSDQTYCRRSRHSVAANCVEGLASASTHDSTFDEIYDIFSKPSASSLHLIKHITVGEPFLPRGDSTGRTRL